MSLDKGDLKKINISPDDFKHKFGMDLNLFLDAVSLGLEDEKISDLIGCSIQTAKEAREFLGNINSEIGINYRKNLPHSSA